MKQPHEIQRYFLLLLKRDYYPKGKHTRLEMHLMNLSIPFLGQNLLIETKEKKKMIIINT